MHAGGGEDDHTGSEDGPHSYSMLCYLILSYPILSTGLLGFTFQLLVPDTM